MKPYIIILCLSLISAFATAQTSSDPQYEVPLKSAYRISGTYGELRGNHYHAGLDMGTMGVENIEVHAAEAGWVSRVKVGPYGYGRALYIDHPDGHTTVYGHLNGFATKIDKAIREKQYAEQNFEVTIFPAKGEIPVERDEVVAYSGNTGGSGGPHLHFEVRETESEEPLNPLRFINAVNDVTKPTIFGIKLYALGDDAQISSSCSDKYVSLAQARGKTFYAYGLVGVGVHCTDYVQANGRPCGIIEINLYDNNNLVYKSRVDHFSFDLNKHVNSHIDFAERQNNGRFIQRSFVSPGNKLPIYSNVKTPTNIAEGERHEMRYEIKDFAGNVSSVSFTLLGHRNAQAKAKAEKKGDLVEWEYTWAKDTLGMSVVIGRETLYEDTKIAVSEGDSLNGARVFSVGDATIPLQKNYQLTLPVPNKWKSLGKQVFVGRKLGKSLSYIGGEMAEDPLHPGQMLITAQCPTMGTFSVGVDTNPPTVGIRNKTRRLSSGNYILIGVGDDKSGISTYNVWIDGKWEVFEYDYKNTRLKAQISYLGLKTGKHTLHAEVTDACGNMRSLDWTFESY